MTGLVLVGRRRGRAVLAGMDPDPRRARHLLRRPIIEGYVLAPKLVGESIGLHPVWLMFALFAFGYLFGFVGLLIAVPLAAVIGVLVRFALRQYLASPFYTGEPATGRVGFTASSARSRIGPMSVPRQLALALPHAESFAREDFLTGASNARRSR